MAVRFSATGQHFTSTAVPSATTFTISCWVKITTDRNTYSTVWSIDDGTGFGSVYIESQVDGTTIELATNGTSRVVGPNMTVGTWYFLAVTKSGANVSFYYAAATAASLTLGTSAAGDSPSVTTLRIGQWPGSTTEWINGCVTAFKVWDGVALSQAEVEAERWSYIPRRTAGLHRWHPWLTNETVDYSGNARTLSGGSGSSTEDGPPISWAAIPVLTDIPVGGSTTYNQSVAGTLTTTAVLAKQGQRRLLGTVTSSSIVAKRPNRSLSASTASSGALIRSLIRTLSGTSASSGTISKVPARSITGTVTPSATLVKAASRSLSAAFSSNGILARAVNRSLSGSVAPSGSLIRAFTKTLTGAFTPSGILAKLTSRALSGSTTPTATVIKIPARRLTGGFTPLASIAKRVNRLLGGSITPSGALSSLVTFIRNFSGSLASNGSVSKAISRTLTATQAVSGLVTRSTARNLSGSTTPTATLTKTTSRTLVASLTSSGIVSKARSTLLIGTLTSVGTLLRQLNKTTAGSVGTSGAPQKQVNRNLASEVTLTGSVNKLFNKNLSGATNLLGAILRTVNRFVSGSTATSAQVDTVVGNLIPPPIVISPTKILLEPGENLIIVAAQRTFINGPGATQIEV